MGCDNSRAAGASEKSKPAAAEAKPKVNFVLGYFIIKQTISQKRTRMWKRHAMHEAGQTFPETCAFICRRAPS